MKFLIVLGGILFAYQGVLVTGDNIEFDDSALEVVHNIHKRDIFDNVRLRLNRLVDRLNSAANDFNNAALQFVNHSTIHSDSVVNSVQATTNGWLEEVDTAINTVLNSTSNIIGSVTQCLAAQENNAVELVNGTITGVVTCVGDVIDGATGTLAGGGELVIAATLLAIRLSGDIINCGVANILNLAQVGMCLNGLSQKYTNEVNSLIGKIVGFTSILLFNVLSIPTTFASCLGSTVAIAAFQIINIIQEIPTCIIENIG